MERTEKSENKILLYDLKSIENSEKDGIFIIASGTGEKNEIEIIGDNVCEELPVKSTSTDGDNKLREG